MKRVRHPRFVESVGPALDLIPEAIRRRVENVDIFAGADPVFAGLHSYEEMTHGRSYRSTTHVVYPWHIKRPASDRVTTLVLCEPEPLWVIVHELGHVLDEALGFDHTAQPTTDYSKTNRGEAFAEAFTAWIKPDEYAAEWLQDKLHEDRATIHLFEELAAA